MASVTNPPTARNVNKPWTLQHRNTLNKAVGPREAIFDIANMPSDYFWETFTFNDSTIVAAKWATAAAGGTAFAYNAQRGGAVRGITAASATLNLLGNIIFDAADNPGMIIKFKTPATMTNVAIEVGFADALVDTALVNISALTAAAVPTAANGFADGGIYVINQGLTLTTSAAVGVGTSTAIAGTAIGTYTPTGSAWVTIQVEVSAGKTYVRVWEAGVEQGTVGGYSVASGPDAGVLMRPYFLISALTAATKQIDIAKVILYAQDNR